MTEQEWTPKQGERILVYIQKMDSWSERIFGVMYKGLFYCESVYQINAEMPALTPWKLAKPLK